jgi:hypothetical protein
MGYNKLLDTWFSSFWYTGVLILVMLAVGMLFRRFFLTDRKYKFGLGVFYFALFMFVLFSYLYINPAMWGYGNAVEVAGLETNGQSVAVLDYVLEAGDEAYDPTEQHRIHFLDLATGKKQNRVFVGAGYDMKGCYGDVVVFHRYGGQYVFVNGKTAQIEQVVDNKSLPKQFTELQGGVENIQEDGQNGGLKILAKTGKEFLLRFDNRQLTAMPPPPKSPFVEGEIELDDDVVRVIRDLYPRYTYQLRPVPHGSDKLKQLHNEQDSVLNPQQEYLDGRFVAMDKTDSVLVILHFETTDHLQFRITAASMKDGKIRWQLRQEELQFAPRELYTKNKLPVMCFKQPEGRDDRLLFSYNKEVLLLDMQRGTVIWKTQL